MAAEEITDAEVVPTQADVTAAARTVVEGVQAEARGAEIVRVERRSEVLRPLDSETLLASFEDYQKLLQRLLISEDWQGRPNAPGSFVKKKGWRKIATAFDLDLKRVSSSVERDEEGNPLRAEACYVAIAPSGRSMDGDGYCSVDESRFSKASGRQKLEHDLQSTATTRAKNRAISDLVGMGAVSAEEVDTTPGDTSQAGPPYGEEASPAVAASARQAVAWMLAAPVNSEQVTALLAQIEKRSGGYLPAIAALGIGHVAAAAREARKQRETTPAGEGDPAGETPEEKREREDAEAVVARAEQGGVEQ